MNETLNLNFNSLREINGSSVVHIPAAAVEELEMKVHNTVISFLTSKNLTSLQKLTTLNSKKYRLQFWVQVISKGNLLLLFNKNKSHHFLNKKKRISGVFLMKN